MSAVLPPSAMRRVTCTELRELAAAYRMPLHYAAARCARETKLYLHWTAGHYGQFFADYHVQIDAGGGIYVIGDGALTGGMAWEALNNIATSKNRRIAIIINGACGWAVADDRQGACPDAWRGGGQRGRRARPRALRPAHDL